MERDYTNIYYNARHTAGLTQERWAELLGLSVDSVKQYEAGKITPSDEVVLRMAEAAGQHIIYYWHLLHKSRVAGQILPQIERRTLPEAVLTLLTRLQRFQSGNLSQLMELAADGKIDEDEVRDFGVCLDELRELIQAAYQIEYAGRGGTDT